MGAIRPFSHHHCLQSLAPNALSFSLSLAMLHPLYRTFSIKIAFVVEEWSESLKECVRKKARLRGKEEEGGGRSSNQQLTGVRMFMGRVSLSDWSSVQL